MVEIVCLCVVSLLCAEHMYIRRSVCGVWHRFYDLSACMRVRACVNAEGVLLYSGRCPVLKMLLCLLGGKKGGVR